ncbi:hypothetical protein QCA50_000729 [Cerrena zonata]|uniref:F-box domain-containing protein n=1 Tax=Cerrena zonata TaxID=2478898 RepID=A0AAW0GU54_9APHY
MAQVVIAKGVNAKHQNSKIPNRTITLTFSLTGPLSVCTIKTGDPAEGGARPRNKLNKLVAAGRVPVSLIKKYALETFHGFGDIVDTTSTDAFLTWVHPDAFIRWLADEVQVSRVPARKRSSSSLNLLNSDNKHRAFEMNNGASRSGLHNRSAMTVVNIATALDVTQHEPKTFSNIIIPNDLLYDTVFSFCTPTTFLRLSRTCQSARAAVQSYMRRAFRTDRIYSRFFTSPVAFRRMQARTGALVSGSTALQFFDRSRYSEADLDIYVPLKYRLEVADFLFNDGYSYVPERNQDSDFRRAASDLRLKVGGSYSVNGVVTVFTFEKRRDSAKVMKAQLIVVKYSPIETILGFHSTCVMNVISCDMAYSLYPKATFGKRSSLICIPATNSQTATAHAKYRKRGWSVRHTFTEFEFKNDYHLDVFRSMGDKHCWSIPLDPIPITERIPLSQGSKPLEHDPVVTSSWLLGHERNAGGRMDFNVFDSERLACYYVVSSAGASLAIQYLNNQHETASGNKNHHCDADYISKWLKFFRARRGLF